MQLPEIPLDPPLRKGETPCLRRTHVRIRKLISPLFSVTGDKGGFILRYLTDSEGG